MWCGHVDDLSRFRFIDIYFCFKLLKLMLRISVEVGVS